MADSKVPQHPLLSQAICKTLNQLALQDEALYALAAANIVAFICQPSQSRTLQPRR